MNICESLTVSAKLFPNHAAVIWNGSSISYAELDTFSVQAARHLIDSRVEPGDRVAMMLPNTPSFPIWYYAVLRIGAIAVSISTRLAGSEVNYIVEDCQAKTFVGNEDSLQLVANELPKCVNARIDEQVVGFGIDHSASEFTELSGTQPMSTWFNAEPDDPALILYTSGTTGFPKGATLSHRNVRSNVCAFNHLCNMRHGDVVLLAVPLFHCFGQNALLNSVLNVGGTLVMQQKFDLNESKRLIAEHRVNQLYGVPMMFQLLMESCKAEELASVEYCFSAAAKLPEQVGAAWQAKFDMPIHEGYGLTETSPFASYNHRDKFVPGSIGTPIDCVEMKIVDTETGAPCSPGELGEIAIRGPNVMLGYWNRDEETRKAIRQGWFHSGDIGRVDDQGRFYIVDRVKDMITIGGLKVFPAEVERVLMDCESVAEIAVVGAPDPVFGEQVVAFFVALDACSIESDRLSDQVASFAKQHLGGYKVPRRFLVVDALPRNASGKILKTKLREIAGRPTDALQTTVTDQTFAAKAVNSPRLAVELHETHASERIRAATRFLQQLVQEIVESDHQPEANQTFVDAGMDSLMIVDLVTRLQIESGNETELPATLIFDYPRISDLAAFLCELLTKSKPEQTRPESPKNDLRSEIEQMSEEQALQELLKEL